jgi:hypothetical protein
MAKRCLPSTKESNKTAKSDCYRCEWYRDGDAGNVCHVTGWGYFDVEQARRIIKRARRKAVYYDSKKLNRIVSPNSTVTEPHIAHVNTRKAGIVAFYKPKDGPAERFLLEGRHRSVKCLLNGRGFRLYELTKEETTAIFIGRRVPKGKQFEAKAAN